MADLTNRQAMILDYIRCHKKAKGYAPSMTAIGQAVGLASSSSVYHQLRQLQKKGYIRRDPRLPRAITIVDPTTEKGPSAVVTPYETWEVLEEYDWFHGFWGYPPKQVAERLDMKLDTLETILRRHGGDRWPPKPA